MTVLAGWSAAMALLLWLKQGRWAWAAAVGTMPAAVDSQIWAVAIVALLSAAVVLAHGQPNPKSRERDVRAALARFWQQVAVLLTAGLTFWQAVDVSAQSEPLVYPTIAQAAESLTRRAHRPPQAHGLPTDDGPLTLLLLQHGYLHGATGDQIEAQVRHLEARLTYEDEAKKRRDPIWMTVLPAVLLLNVLWVFLAPMVAMAGHSWLKL